MEKEGQNVMSVSILLKLIGVMVEGWGLITEATKQESLKDCRDIKEEYLKDFIELFGKNRGLFP